MIQMLNERARSEDPEIVERAADMYMDLVKEKSIEQNHNKGDAENATDAN